MLKILIADDHEVVRKGLVAILKDEYADAKITEASNTSEILCHAAEKKWDLMLFDILMPGRNIIEVIGEVRRKDPAVPILMLTAISDYQYALSSIKAGANGYITKQHASDELILAIKKVLNGETYLNVSASQGLAANLRSGDPLFPHEKLSPREMEIFISIASGKTVKEIAAELQLSEKTVATHLSRIREKTGLQSYVEITRYALQKHLVQ